MKTLNLSLLIAFSLSVLSGCTTPTEEDPTVGNDNEVAGVEQSQDGDYVCAPDPSDNLGIPEGGGRTSGDLTECWEYRSCSGGYNVEVDCNMDRGTCDCIVAGTTVSTFEMMGHCPDPETNHDRDPLLQMCPFAWEREGDINTGGPVHCLVDNDSTVVNDEGCLQSASFLCIHDADCDDSEETKYSIVCDDGACTCLRGDEVSSTFQENDCMLGEYELADRCPEFQIND